MSKEITIAAFWITKDKIRCPCGMTLNVDLKQKFEEAYRHTCVMNKELSLKVEELEEEIKQLKQGRYTLLNDGDQLCNTDEPSIIYEYAIECIKNGGNPKELSVYDNDGGGRKDTIIQFLWMWGY